MAKETPAPPIDEADEWERVPTGTLSGKEWDFDRDGPLVGNFLGAQTVETKKQRGDGQTVATAYLFAVNGDPNNEAFVWESTELRAAFGSDILRLGDRVRVRYLGRDQFTGDDGSPRQIKRFAVDMAKHPA